MRGPQKNIRSIFLLYRTLVLLSTIKKKMAFLFIFTLAVFSIPVYAEMPDDTLEVLEEGLCSEGVPYEVDGSISLLAAYNLRRGALVDILYEKSIMMKIPGRYAGFFGLKKN